MASAMQHLYWNHRN